MPPKTKALKRKALTRDSPKSEKAAVYDELGNGPLELDTANDEDEQSESEASSDPPDFSDEGVELEYDHIESDEVPSEEEDGLEAGNEAQKAAQDGKVDYEEEARSRSLKPFKIAQDANGNPRYLYNDIEPVYDSDDSEAPPDQNTIGNIPLSFYDAYPHIGYDINGKRVMRPAKGAALDSLLDSIDIPEGWTGLTDPATGKPLELNPDELDVLRKVARNEAAGEGYDPYPEMVEYFTSRVEQMPLSAAPEPKRRFIPSKNEHKRVMKLVKAIREGRIKPYKPPTASEEEEEPEHFAYDVWANEAPRPDHPMNIPAPKLPPPGYDESYHPPPEYLPDEKERQEWEAMDDEDKQKDYLPSDHSALRKVPGYARFVKEKFERCLDLYLAPRVRRNKLNIDPDSLLPKLPDPDDLRPFPSKQSAVFHGHEGVVRALSVRPDGGYFASGGDDGYVCIWKLDSISTPAWKVKLSDDAVDALQWRPGTDVSILAAAAAETVYFITPELDKSSESLQAAKDLLTAGFIPTSATTTPQPSTWSPPPTHLKSQHIPLQLTVRSPIKSLNWHRHGNHLVTVSPSGQRSALAIHTLSTHLTQLPLRNLKGYTQHAAFHPTKPVLFVGTQRTIRSYDLSKQELLKTLLPGARWLSHFDVHPQGDNLVVSAYDKKTTWMDLDLSSTPYKTLRFHARGVRRVKFSRELPLFADASDDGTVQVFYGKAGGDLMEDAVIVPLTVLRGHEVRGSVGVTDVAWCAGAGVLSAGGDGTVRLWTP